MGWKLLKSNDLRLLFCFVLSVGMKNLEHIYSSFLPDSLLNRLERKTVVLKYID